VSRQSVADFLEHVAENEGLRMKFARFAAEQGYDLGGLSEGDVKAVLGGTAPVEPEGWFRTRAAERRSGEDRRSDVLPVSVDRRGTLRRGRCVPRSDEVDRPTSGRREDAQS
jgi:hypothetical protein